jgi:hypothetical protein
MKRYALLAALGIAAVGHAHADPVITSVQLTSPWPPYPTVACASPPGARSNILTVRGKGLGNSASTTSTGTAEGYYIFDPPPGRNIALGGHGQHIHCPLPLWTDTRIIVLLGRTCVATSGSATRLRGRSYYVGIERSDHTRWLSNLKSFRTCP